MQLDMKAGTPEDEGFTGTADQLKDPYTNIFYGSEYFLHQLQRYNNVDQAILAYNAGSYEVNSAGVAINLPYLNDVLSFLAEKKTSLSPEPSHILSTERYVKIKAKIQILRSTLAEIDDLIS